MNALLSVSDKTGLIELAQTLVSCGVNLISTGGSAKALRDHGIAVKEVSELTHFPEMLDGRVKTLHPVVHAGLLAKGELDVHMQTLKDHGIERIDILVVNLYPFEQTVANPDCSLEEAIEQIDIGGPAMVRSAAKNWKDVAVLTDPSQYGAFIKEFKVNASISQKSHFALSVAAFNRIAQYDAAIGNYLSSFTPEFKREQFPEQLNQCFVKVQDLRYGENPHQEAAFYKEIHPRSGTLVTSQQFQGKELSYNNIADADAAWECVKSFNAPACVIVKHANPCGVAVADSVLHAYQKAFKTDPTSAFGGIIALNREVGEELARELMNQFMEVLMAPSYSASALQILASKPNVRVLEIKIEPQALLSGDLDGVGRNLLDFKRIGSGVLVQTADHLPLNEGQLRVVTKIAPTPEQMQDLMFAWRVATYVKSNAIVFCSKGMTLGVGAGQMSRLDSAKIASIKAQEAGLSLLGSVVASDAFFPFRDGLDVVIASGAKAVIQPGGSMRDAEVIAAADEQGVAMVMTSVRHFRH
jgi:phosphoribosylaminoimidazolecarboxamide formyltransferase/IMP cyclohydrolase